MFKAITSRLFRSKVNFVIKRRKDFAKVYVGRVCIARIIPRCSGNVSLRMLDGDEIYVNDDAALERLKELVECRS